MGEYADMMIEAMQNDGWVDGVRIDPETGEVLEIEDEDTRTPEERQLAYITPRLEKLRAQGFTVKMFTPWHIRINNELEFYCGKRGCSYRRVGINRKPRPCDGILSIVHNYFGSKGKGIAAASFKQS